MPDLPTPSYVDDEPPRRAWMPDYSMEAPEGFVWVKPASEPCPNCPCCSLELCAKAQQEDKPCHWLGRSADFDLSRCPCWRSDAPRLDGAA